MKVPDELLGPGLPLVELHERHLGLDEDRSAEKLGTSAQYVHLVTRDVHIPGELDRGL